ncbi:hypothetical protein ABZ774_14125 [Streptomyces sp. NPDC047802]|uniref:hypothetical protein n=1 Tax=Streptomyces sp. NPDC047802 TaxID=3157204 RepID=UPI0034093A60
MDLASQLRDLRAQADSPSYRTLENLIKRQGRRQKMARSSIQEKLSGSGTLTLTQVLSIVDALVEYARMNEVPLPSNEIDHEVWKSRLLAARSDTEVPSTGTVTDNWSVASHPEWDIGPLLQAHMVDLVSLVTDGRSKAISTWLPRVIREMMNAEMDVDDFLEKAAGDTPLGGVQTLASLEREFPYSLDSGNPWEPPERNGDNEATVGLMLFYIAKCHGETSTPAVLVGLRRSEMGHHVDDYLRTVAEEFPAHTVVNVMKHLEMAALRNDRFRLVNSVGQSRNADRVPEVVKQLIAESEMDLAKSLLRGVGATNTWRVGIVAAEMERSLAPDGLLLEIVRGMSNDTYNKCVESPPGTHSERFAKILVDGKGELPPF